MNCHSCHSQESFAAATLDCLSCHAETDHDALAAHIDIFGSDCLACHDGDDRYSDFEHADVYPLDGAHTDLDCADCHQDQTFAGTPRDCYQLPRREKSCMPNIFGNKCERCHATTAWLPAELKTHTFLVDHGIGDGELACETCHEHTYTQYPCYSCHDQQEMQDLPRPGRHLCLRKLHRLSSHRPRERRFPVHRIGFPRLSAPSGLTRVAAQAPTATRFAF